MIKYIIMKSNQYFVSFVNSFTKQGKSTIQPQFGTIPDLALKFHSKNDALSTAARIGGTIQELQ